MAGDREKGGEGGGAPKFDKGWYVEPTILYDVDSNARIGLEEIFGLVMSVIPFTDEAQALEIANATPYGLATADGARRFLQLRGNFRITGTVGGEPLSDEGTGFFETYVTGAVGR